MSKQKVIEVMQKVIEVAEYGLEEVSEFIDKLKDNASPEVDHSLLHDVSNNSAHYDCLASSCSDDSCTHECAHHDCCIM